MRHSIPFRDTSSLDLPGRLSERRDCPGEQSQVIAKVGGGTGAALLIFCDQALEVVLNVAKMATSGVIALQFAQALERGTQSGLGLGDPQHQVLARTHGVGE